jgi:hypothetical protein
MGMQNKGDSAFGQRSTVLIPKFSLVLWLK